MLPLWKALAQSDTLTVNKQEKEKFNFENYSNYVPDPNYLQSKTSIDGVYRKGKERIRIVTADRSHISLEREWDDKQYREIYHYSIGSKELMLYAKYFSRVPCGIWKQYNDEGILIEETNHDNNKHFKFSVEDLIEKMQQEYKININDKDLITIDRHYKENFDISFYSIIVRPFKDSDNHDGYIIDGLTGKTLMIKAIRRGKDPNIIRAFLSTFE